MMFTKFALFTAVLHPEKVRLLTENTLHICFDEVSGFTIFLLLFVSVFSMYYSKNHCTYFSSKSKFLLVNMASEGEKSASQNQISNNDYLTTVTSVNPRQLNLCFSFKGICQKEHFGGKILNKILLL